MKPACTNRCSGCALKPGATANLEVTNRMTGMLAVLGGITFHCHEALGWTHDKSGYPVDKSRLHNAASNLLTAPKLIHDTPGLGEVLTDATATGIPPEVFDEDRAILGRRPVCSGWKIGVAKLATLGWFKDPFRRKEMRARAAAGMKALDRLKEESSKSAREQLILEIRSVMAWFSSEQQSVLGVVINPESK